MFEEEIEVNFLFDREESVRSSPSPDRLAFESSTCTISMQIYSLINLNVNV
jgi:hypothetical protein